MLIVDITARIANEMTGRCRNLFAKSFDMARLYLVSMLRYRFEEKITVNDVPRTELSSDPIL